MVVTKTRSEEKESVSDREIVISRVFSAPRAMVWEALADPWQVGQWWGPKGFTTTILEMDLRAGGKWRLVMQGPDGTKYPNEMVFTEVVSRKRIVLELTGGREGAPPERLTKTMTFTDEDGGTRFTIRIGFLSAEARDKNVREYGSIEGGKQTMERLEKYLSERGTHAIETEAKHELKITRVFDAPRELVWRAWTDPEMMKQWSGPKQFPASHIELGKKPGDRWRICLRGCPPGTDTPVEVWQGGVLREIVPPELLVYTFAWDRRADVGLTDDGDPHETVVTVRFEEHNGKTTMHFHQAFFTTTGERDGHNGGWSSSFERLEELIHSSGASH
jgi:uncharacterized protein YndB with AHSA1/START domain